MTKAFGAVDIGASGMRVMLGQVDRDDIRLSEVLRVPNAPFHRLDGWHWDVDTLLGRARAGLGAADAITALSGIAIDSWGLDYGLISPSGALIDAPFSYRDERSIARVHDVHEHLTEKELYALTGCQMMPINTVYQLMDDQIAGRLDAAGQFLTICDLFAYELSGVAGADESNASTTGLFDPLMRDWNWNAIDQIGLERRHFAPVRPTGSILSETTLDSALRPGIPVITAAGHDTAAAFVASGGGANALIISLGTWALVGVERGSSITTETARQANFTNEVGVFGTIRFLRNAAGMWILQECMREWRESDSDLNWSDLINRAQLAEPLSNLFDPDDPRFMTPGPMASRVIASGDGRDSLDQGGIVRSVLESMALNYRWILEAIQNVTGSALDVIKIVGGGSRNELLCQMTADATGLPVVAGPEEATAIGNVAMQAIATGAISDLERARAAIRKSFPPREYRPHNALAWNGAYSRWCNLISR